MSIQDTEGLFQSQSGHKTDPSFREEDQHMAAELQPVVMAPPGYSSPDPGTSAGRLVPVEQSQLAVSEDYGDNVTNAPGMEAVSSTDNVETTLTPEEELRANAQQQSESLPDNREEWTKAHYQTQARAYGLNEKGNKTDLQERVEEFEGAVDAAKEMNAEQWKEAVDSADDAEDLAELRSVYASAGADYSTVEAAFDAKQAEFDGQQ